MILTTNGTKEDEKQSQDVQQQEDQNEEYSKRPRDIEKLTPLKVPVPVLNPFTTLIPHQDTTQEEKNVEADNMVRNYNVSTY